MKLGAQLDFFIRSCFVTLYNNYAEIYIYIYYLWFSTKREYLNDSRLVFRYIRTYIPIMIIHQLQCLCEAELRLTSNALVLITE